MLDYSKDIQKIDIPVELIKGNSDLVAEIACKYFNESLEKSKFIDYLKLANVTAFFKKDARTLKNNYGPVSILPSLPKLFERLISKQISECLLMMLETWKEAIDNNKAFRALWTDHRKLLIA